MSFSAQQHILIIRNIRVAASKQSTQCGPNRAHCGRRWGTHCGRRGAGKRPRRRCGTGGWKVTYAASGGRIPTPFGAGHRAAGVTRAGVTRAGNVGRACAGTKSYAGPGDNRPKGGQAEGAGGAVPGWKIGPKGMPRSMEITPCGRYADSGSRWESCHTAP